MQVLTSVTSQNIAYVRTRAANKLVIEHPYVKVMIAVMNFAKTKEHEFATSPSIVQAVSSVQHYNT